MKSNDLPIRRPSVLEVEEETYDVNAQNPDGVPIDAIVFGGRRATTMPLIFQALDWNHGVYVGATMGSEMTAAAAGTLGKVRRDPMAMLPFCGYNMGDYFGHWLEMAQYVTKLPQIFHVNWFRKSAEGKFLWPGYGDNMRVLEWIVKRCNGQAAATDTKVGASPSFEDFNTAGIDGFTKEQFEQLMALDSAEWQAEVTGQAEFFASLGDHLPQELLRQRELLIDRLA